MKPSPNVIAIHGIHDDGDDGIDELARDVALEVGAPIFLPTLRRSSALGDYFAGNVEHDAEKVARYLNSRSLVLTHSRGAYVLDQALRHFGKWADKVFMFAPALPSNIVPGAGRFNHAWVMHNKYDRALKWSRFLPWHPYANFFGGSLGRDGYTGANTGKITNIRNDSDRSFLDHSEYWADANERAAWAAHVVKWARL